MPVAKSATNKKVVLTSRGEVDAYLAEHLTPVGYTPAGRPVYDHAQVRKLKIQFRKS